MVAEARQRVRESEPYRRELAEDRALVEGDRGERPDERRREEGRALPEDREHERQRGHDREGDERRGDGPPQQGEEAVAGPPADDGRDERQVDDVERGRGEGDLDREPGEAVVRHRGAHSSGRGGRQPVHRRVVEHADGRLASAHLDEELGEEADQDRGRPAVDDPGADDEDRGERGSPDGDVFDRDREGLDERGGEEQRHNARESRGRRLVRRHRREGQDADERAAEDDRGDNRQETRRLAGYPGRPRRLRAGIRNCLRDGHVAPLVVPAGSTGGCAAENFFLPSIKPGFPLLSKGTAASLPRRCASTRAGCSTTSTSASPTSRPAKGSTGPCWRRSDWASRSRPMATSPRTSSSSAPTGRRPAACTSPFRPPTGRPFTASTRPALAAGGRDNGAPGERHYHPGYYGAYVLDPDGNNVEAVYHGPSTRSAASVEIEPA